MHSPMKSVSEKIHRMYECYAYWMPIPVLTKGEEYVLNTIVLSLVVLLTYWLVVIMPPLTAHAIENIYYYLTGNSVSLKVIASIVISRNIWTWSSPRLHNTTTVPIAKHRMLHL